MSVTFKEVAELAGVSTQTVSRVTNGASNVAEETRKKVLAAIDELGYVPNKGAQMLSRAKARVIGLITLDIGLHGASLIASGIRKQAQDKGYAISLSVIKEQNFDSILNAVRDLKSQQAERIIVNYHLRKQEAESLVTQFPEIHFVFIDVPPTSKVNFVTATHYEGAHESAKLLLSQNRKHFLLITGPKDSTASQLRHKGWKDAIKETDAIIVAEKEGNWTPSSGYTHTKQTLAMGNKIDAILVASDQMALGVLRALNEFGVKVPEQTSVVGFDDIEDSAFFIPPLTTVRQDFLAVGQKAVDYVLSDDEESTGLHKETVDTLLVERETTGLTSEMSYDKKTIQNLLNQINQLLP